MIASMRLPRTTMPSPVPVPPSWYWRKSSGTSFSHCSQVRFHFSKTLLPASLTSYWPSGTPIAASRSSRVSAVPLLNLHFSAFDALKVRFSLALLSSCSPSRVS